MRPATREEVEQLVAARVAELERRVAPEALTVRDVAARLRLSVSRVNELISSGALPSYRIGRLRRVDPGDLAAFLAERRAVAPAAPTARPASHPAGHDWLAAFRKEAYGA